MSDPIELLERRIQAVLDGTKSTSGLHLFAQIGGRYDDVGITTLQVSGSGWALLSHRIDDETDMYSVHLPNTDMQKLYSMIVENPWWRASPKRRPSKPGETNFHFRFSDQQAGTVNGIQFWSRDTDEFPALRPLIERFLRLIANISEGDISMTVDELV